ncbi:glycoside hydrolase family 15 protein [Lentzea sp. BCCO 10_0856]|uniref:Glycoside hydrolase family 15 protein n=1 Tax=Lentzea miocenica TaxID=3095431 RepID=A0ABU4SW31_9PSEU|nr:glycoside hydrolase family 15 protein [Lentzea sp. BCCO 10_0856]MDX8030024.1 glycoside hydrolase family 15 protein [Lentzea sp. BCCO 10_0856]
MKSLALVVLLLVTMTPVARAAPDVVPLPADKQAFGTARSTASPVWFTLGHQGLSEIFHPDLSTPATRETRLLVDGKPGQAYTEPADDRSLTFRQRLRGDGWRAEITYVTDPRRAAVLADVSVRAERPVRLSIDHVRIKGSSDVAGSLPTNPVRRAKGTFAVGFGDGVAQAALNRGFASAAREYARGWHTYLDGLKRPKSADRRLYDQSVMVLAATEDKANPGASIASPSFPWAFGFDRELAPELGPYALVWPRDLYHVSTAMIAAGDRGFAGRALDFMLRKQQRPDGHLPQNTRVDGTPVWTKVQLDQTAAPLLLAHQLGRHDKSTVDSLRRSADYLLAYPNSPFSEQERWENQDGYSPATIASVVAGLVCFADLLQRNGENADRYLTAADEWQRKVESWTATKTGPYSPKPYYLRLTKDGNPDAPTKYNLGDNNPTDIDQRAVVDPSFLELVRLGVKRADDPVIRNTVAVVDQQLKEQGYWHRFTQDGYGETADGRPWGINWPTPTRTYGRLWPLLSGERGEYELLLNDKASAAKRLSQIAATANSGLMLPEQVWDGRGTTSATPLAWTHAQYVRLAWSLDRGTPVERPSVVVRRYLS